MKIGTKNIVSKHFGSLEVIKEVFNGSVVYEATPTPSVDPVLANNSWETIKAVCEAGNAGNYWAVGDTKTDVGTDSTTRTMRICDMQGLYGKHVVFEQVELEASDYAFDNVSYTNDYRNSSIKTTMNSTIKGYYSSVLQSALTYTTVKVAQNGSSSSVIDVTGYLFLPAEKEIFGNQNYSVESEASALTQYQYYSTHNTNADRKKYRGGEAKNWWLRSPVSGQTGRTCIISSSGSMSYANCSNTYGLAPCFAF